MRNPTTRSTVLCSSAAALLLQLPASVRADTTTELQAQVDELLKKVGALERKQAAAEANPPAAASNAVTAGDLPGSFKLPGSTTSVKLGGYVKLDAVFSDISAGVGSTADLELEAGAIPVGPAAGANERSQLKLHARQSRFFLQTSTPSGWGDVGTYLEFDLFGASGNESVSNSHGLRVRHAHGTLGRLLGGQTWTTASDVAVYPETVNFGRPSASSSRARRRCAGRSRFRAGSGRSRSRTRRRSRRCRAATRFAPTTIASRTPQATSSSRPPGASTRSPAASASCASIRRARRRAATRSGAARSASTALFRSARSTTYACRRTTVMRSVATRPGSSRTRSSTPAATSSCRPVDGDGCLPPLLEYEPALDLGALGPALAQPAGTAGSVNRGAESAHLNLIWSPTPQTNLGIEYIHASREIENGQSGRLNRLQAAAQYLF
jgi:hypothetical protein